ncbi:MAG: hypothetical protein A3F91_09600 [Flavobacteria bacterium RIFCSPLOWO2_12_FULL_35_11]|nr:MAG: hypothetical protein A3F91_09600 [Flavobacteria bacterium RIFCSPLOWO2_12_FULL_35_11]
MLEIVLLLSVATVLLAGAYILGVKRGINTPFALASNNNDISYSFESGTTHHQTLNKIESVVRENALLKKEMEALKRLKEVSFFIFDALHNLHSKQEAENKGIKDEGLDQIREFLCVARWCTDETYLRSAEDYKRFLNFIKNDLVELGFNRKLYEKEKLNEILLATLNTGI